MVLNLPSDVWVMLAGAGILFLLPVILIYLVYRLLRE
jgi:hypothetical protein